MDGFSVRSSSGQCQIICKRKGDIAKKKVFILTLLVMMLLALLPAVTGAQDVVECAEEVVVQKADWLSKYADKYFGNVLSWPAIMAWNNRAAEHVAAPAVREEYSALPDHADLELADLLELTDDDFRAGFRRTPIWRCHPEGLRATARVVLDNLAQGAGA